MNCEETIERFSDRLTGGLDEATERGLAEHLARCPACRDEAAAVERLWQNMGALDEQVPSERMRARFHAAIRAWAASDRSGIGGRLRAALERLWPGQPALQAALVLAALVLGVFLGGRSGSGTSAEIQALRTDMQAMRETVSLALLAHPSASERLRAVEWALEAEPEARVVDALLDRVRNDTSINVRLAAVQALAPLAGRPAVGSALLAALDRQQSAVVRLSLAELLLDARVDGAQAAVRRLLEGPQVDETVREQLRSAMQRQAS